MNSGDAFEPDWVTQVLEFWFRDLGREGWFAKSDAVDASIRSRFARLHERILNGRVPAPATARTLLATVIVLDQFSRNMFRGTPQAFACDPEARRLARTAVERRFDAGLTRDERMFLYLPFEHSEDREDQALSVKLIGQLGNEEWTRYALAHQALIDRFGRFPHRNAVLGRTSTPEELAVLAEPMGSF